MQTVTFAKVELKATRLYLDAAGKRRQKTKVFMQTINPFNKNANGEVKSRSEILAELNGERLAWLAGPLP